MVCLVRAQGSLVSRWNQVRAEAQEEEELRAEEERPRSVEEIELAKKQRIAEWQREQLSGDAAEGNVNFQPTVGDWRSRVAKARQNKPR